MHGIILWNYVNIKTIIKKDIYYVYIYILFRGVYDSKKILF